MIFLRNNLNNKKLQNALLYNKTNNHNVNKSLNINLTYNKIKDKTLNCVYQYKYKLAKTSFTAAASLLTKNLVIKGSLFQERKVFRNKSPTRARRTLSRS